MTGDAVANIAGYAERAAAQTVTIDGREYSTVALHDPRKPKPQPTPFVLSTLSGLAGYIDSAFDSTPVEEMLLHVESPTEVALVGPLYGEFKQRDVYARAEIEPAADSFTFGRWYETEELIIAVQSLFDAGGDRPRLLQLLGNIRDDAIRTSSDDGITQTVTARIGVAPVDNVQAPNPVVLAPFRTFTEVEQPASPFVFRLRKGQNGVQGALFEADGGAWRHEAVRSIQGWLQGNVSAVHAVIA